MYERTSPPRRQDLIGLPHHAPSYTPIQARVNCEVNCGYAITSWMSTIRVGFPLLPEVLELHVKRHSHRAIMQRWRDREPTRFVAATRQFQRYVGTKYSTSDNIADVVLTFL